MRQQRGRPKQASENGRKTTTAKKRNRGTIPSGKTLKDLATICDAQIKELREIKIMASLPYVVPESHRKEELGEVWTPDGQYEAYISSDTPGRYVADAAQIALDLGELDIAEHLAAESPWCLPQGAWMPFETAIELLGFCRDEALKRVEQTRNVCASKDLAQGILDILRSAIGKPYTYKQLFNALPDYLRPPLQCHRDRGDEERVRADISSAVALLRRDGHPIPKGKYIYPRSGKSTESL